MLKLQVLLFAVLITILFTPSLASAAPGIYYVVDDSNPSSVLRFDSDGNSAPFDLEEIYNPANIAIGGPKGNLHVQDNGLGGVNVYDSFGHSITSDYPFSSYGVTSIHVDDFENFYYTAKNSNDVFTALKITPNGIQTNFQVPEPISITTDSMGNIYVSDAASNNVFKFDSEGILLDDNLINGDFITNDIIDLVVSGSGDIFFILDDSPQLYLAPSSGNLANPPGIFLSIIAKSIAIDDDDYLYIAGSNKVVKYTSERSLIADPFLSGDFNLVSIALDSTNTPDTQKPVIYTSHPPFLSVELGTVIALSATVSDNDPRYQHSVSFDPSLVDWNAVGTYFVIYTAPADNSYNIPDTITQTITIRDTIRVSPDIPEITTQSGIVYLSPITIDGTGDVDSEIELFLKDISQGTTTVADDGTWQFTGVALSEGRNIFTATASDGMSTSPPSSAVTIRHPPPTVIPDLDSLYVALDDTVGDGQIITATCTSEYDLDEAEFTHAWEFSSNVYSQEGAVIADSGYDSKSLTIDTSLLRAQTYDVWCYASNQHHKAFTPLELYSPKETSMDVITAPSTDFITDVTLTVNNNTPQNGELVTATCNADIKHGFEIDDYTIIWNSNQGDYKNYKNQNPIILEYNGKYLGLNCGLFDGNSSKKSDPLIIRSP